MRGDFPPWAWTMLSALSEHPNGEAALPDIYHFVEDQLQTNSVFDLPAAELLRRCMAAGRCITIQSAL